jgi:NAD(P)H dehydrogenase (quinone)
VGQRERQHGAVIDAANAGGRIVSCLHLGAERAGLEADARARARRDREAARRSGLNYDVLRMPWYSENYYRRACASAIEHGAIYGATG